MASSLSRYFSPAHLSLAVWHFAVLNLIRVSLLYTAVAWRLDVARANEVALWWTKHALFFTVLVIPALAFALQLKPPRRLGNSFRLLYLVLVEWMLSIPLVVVVAALWEGLQSVKFLIAVFVGPLLLFPFLLLSAAIGWPLFWLLGRAGVPQLAALIQRFTRG